jgi:cytochrome c oxidase subunit 4
MAARSRVRIYLVVYAWLLGLTALEVAVVLMGWPPAAVAMLLVATALAKALLIALYFMHLREARPIVWLLPAVPVVLGLAFVAALFPDVVWHLTYRM